MQTSLLRELYLGRARFCRELPQPTLSIPRENYLLQFNGEESIALYDLSTDSTMTENIISNSPEVQQKMENTLKLWCKITTTV